MTYQEATDYLFNRLPMFEKQGAGAYKPGLASTLALAEMFGNPHKSLRSIHIAGTNGKGSTASTLAAVFRSAGLKTGLYTSPHLVDFRERIRVNGEPVSERFVIDFTERFLKRGSDGLAPTFFELTTIMAFKWFEHCGVDIAVIETGLGGRLDSTNIITPLLSIVTNISLDHIAQLGNTLESIASEKAGIFKPGVPALVSEGGPETVRAVFRTKARETGALLRFADELSGIAACQQPDGTWIFGSRRFGTVHYSLPGAFQQANGRGALMALELLAPSLGIESDAVRKGFADVESLSGLMGRWQSLRVGDKRVIVDCGHNRGAWERNAPELDRPAAQGGLAIVFGMVADKDVEAVLHLLPKSARYFFVAPDNHRALPSSETARLAAAHGLSGEPYPTVAAGLRSALASEARTVFVGGSCYIAGEALAALHPSTK